MKFKLDKNYNVFFSNFNKTLSSSVEERVYINSTNCKTGSVEHLNLEQLDQKLVVNRKSGN